MSDSRSAIIVGASAGLGRALATEFAAAGYDLIVAARGESDLQAVASDLELRQGVSVTPRAIDLRASDQELAGFVRACLDIFPNVDAVLLCAGMVDDADDGISDWEMSNALITTNFVAAMKLSGRFISRLEEQGRGSLVLFSTVAAAAPRRRNVAYAAAKNALESYARSMQHRLAGTDVHVQLYRLGYLDTRMARGRKLLLPPADPEKVASQILGRVGEDQRLSYLPRYWRAVVFVLERIPWFLYKRTRF